MKPIILPILLILSTSCSNLSSDIQSHVTAHDIEKYGYIDNRIAHFENDCWYIDSIFCDDGCYYVTYSDPDAFDFGDTPDGCVDCSLTMQIDADSYELLQLGAPTTDAMYCLTCKLWHIHFEGFTYED